MGGMCFVILIVQFAFVPFMFSTVPIRTPNDCDICSASFQAEVDFLGNLHHPNLVRLIGYCVEDDQRLLVYEFMPRGSLDNHLFRSTCLTRFSSH